MLQGTFLLCVDAPPISRVDEESEGLKKKSKVIINIFLSLQFLHLRCHKKERIFLARGSGWRNVQTPGSVSIFLNFIRPQVGKKYNFPHMRWLEAIEKQFQVVSDVWERIIKMFCLDLIGGGKCFIVFSVWKTLH